MKWTEKEAPKTAMEILNRVSGVTIWEEMIRDRRDFCLQKCQINKVVNMLRPKCTDRRYLDILLLSNESKKNMPMFCYSQRVKNLARAFQEGEELIPDVYVYINDFWKIVQEKQSKSRLSASDFLKKTFTKGKEISTIGSLDYQIETHHIRGQLFVIWPKIDLCLINAQETIIHSMIMFSSLVEALTESYGLEVNIEVEDNFIELKFVNLKLKDSIAVGKELQNYPSFTGYSESEIWVEIQLPSIFGEEEFDFKIKDLHNIFKAVSNVLELNETVEKHEVDTIAESSVLEMSKIKNENK